MTPTPQNQIAQILKVEVIGTPGRPGLKLKLNTPWGWQFASIGALQYQHYCHTLLLTLPKGDPTWLKGYRTRVLFSEIEKDGAVYHHVRIMEIFP